MFELPQRRNSDRIALRVAARIWGADAVRMRLAKIRTAQPRLTYVMYVGRPNRDPMRYHFTDWSGDPKNGFMRFVFAPTPGWHLEIQFLSAKIVGSPLEKTMRVSAKSSTSETA